MHFWVSIQLLSDSYRDRSSHQWLLHALPRMMNCGWRMALITLAWLISCVTAHFNQVQMTSHHLMNSNLQGLLSRCIVYGKSGSSVLSSLVAKMQASNIRRKRQFEAHHETRTHLRTLHLPYQGVKALARLEFVDMESWKSPELSNVHVNSKYKSTSEVLAPSNI